MRGLLGAYGRLLRDRHLSRLLAGEFVSGIGDWLYLVAILVIIYERTQDAVLLGIVAAARVLPYVFLSVPAGIVADRFDRRAVLLVTDVARGLLMLLLAALVATGADVALIIGVAICATAFSAFFGPAIGAYLPSLVRDESDLGPANSAYATLNEITYIIGPALAAVVISTLGLALAFLLNALTFGIVAMVLWTLPSSRARSAGRDPEAGDGPADGSGEPETTSPAPAEGTPGAASSRWRAALRPLAAVSLADSSSSFVFGGLGVLTVIIAFERLGTGEAGTGALNAAMGVGGLLGSLVIGILVLRRRLGPPLLLGAAVLAAGVVVLGFADDLLLAMLAIAIASGGALLIEVICTTLLQRIAPDEVRGRAFGALQTVDVIAFAGGSLLIPTLSSAVGLEVVLLVCAAAVLLLTLGSLALLGEVALREPVRVPASARLAGIPELAGLAPYRLEAAQRRLIRRPMRAGETIIREGDEADRYYVIAEGSVEVTQAVPEGRDARILRRMGEGEAFGEIGLLTGVPRTATVTALTDGLLMALDGEAFLELVAEGDAAIFPLADPYLGRTAGRAVERFAEA